MATDVLILNMGIVDLRVANFQFADDLPGEGGLIKYETSTPVPYSQEKFDNWVKQGFAAPGGSGNTAPLIARAGLNVALGLNLGKGCYGGLDSAGEFFYDAMVADGVDMNQIYIHPDLPTAITCIDTSSKKDRGGLAYFPGANDDFNFNIFRGVVEKLKPNIVYYVYSGLSQTGDDNGGRDLAEFIKWCRSKKAITIVDSHTLTSSPQETVSSGRAVDKYRLLEPLLSEVDLFFTSCDEARMIENTLAVSPPKKLSQDQYNEHFLDFLSKKFWQKDTRTRMFGVTINNGAYEKHFCSDGNIGGPNKIKSAFMAGEVIDLVGAGDSFRAGLITYIGYHLDEFKNGSINFSEAVQMGNLFASLYIKAPLGDRCCNIKNYDKMLKVIRSGITYSNYDLLKNALS